MNLLEALIAIDCTQVNIAERLRGDDLLRNCLFVHFGLDDLVVQAIESQFEPVRHTKFVVDLTKVILDYLLRGAQLERNFLVPLPLGNAGNDRHFLR